MSEGKVITCRAAVTWALGEPFKIEEIQVEPPKKGEIRVKITASGIVNNKPKKYTCCGLSCYLIAVSF